MRATVVGAALYAAAMLAVLLVAVLLEGDGPAKQVLFGAVAAAGVGTALMVAGVAWPAAPRRRREGGR